MAIAPPIMTRARSPTVQRNSGFCKSCFSGGPGGGTDCCDEVGGSPSTGGCGLTAGFGSWRMAFDGECKKISAINVASAPHSTKRFESRIISSESLRRIHLEKKGIEISFHRAVCTELDDWRSGDRIHQAWMDPCDPNAGSSEPRPAEYTHPDSRQAQPTHCPSSPRPRPPDRFAFRGIGPRPPHKPFADARASAARPLGKIL